MQLGNRIFPYPVLNHDKELSEFTQDASFELIIKLNQDDEIIRTRNMAVLKDAHFLLKDDDLLSLYHAGKIACYLIVESPSAIYRQKFLLTDQPQTFEIPLGKLKDDVYLSAYCYATCDIHEYSSASFDEDYKEYTFDIAKYDIVAADDGMKFVMDRDLDEDNKVSSIFVMVRNESSDNLISYDMHSDKIYIYLPAQQHDYYTTMNRLSDLNDIFFAMIAIPVLTACFAQLKEDRRNNGYDLQMLIENYRWFKSVLKSYKKEKGVELIESEFDSIQELQLAQIVFNYSTVNGINKIYTMVNNVRGPEDE